MLIRCLSVESISHCSFFTFPFISVKRSISFHVFLFEAEEGDYTLPEIGPAVPKTFPEFTVYETTKGIYYIRLLLNFNLYLFQVIVRTRNENILSLRD